MVRTSLASQDHKKHYQDGDDDDNEYIYTYMEHTLHGKPYFLFPGVLKRWSFQKNCAGIWSFLYYRERWYFFFPKIWSYTLDGKWKMIFLKKIHGNMIFSSNFLKRWSFQKGPRRHMIFLVLSGKMVFFSRKHDIFSLGRKPAMTFLKKCMEIWYFLCTRVGVTNLVSRPLAKKNQGWPYPVKIHLKVIDVLDWHPGKSSSNFLHLHRELLNLHCCPAKKTRKLNI